LGHKQSRKKRESGPLSGPFPAEVERVKEPAGAVPAGRRWLWRLLVLVLVPLVFIGGTELALRIAGYGFPTGYFKKIAIGGENYLVDNDQFGLRFFPAALARIPAPVVMKAKKSTGMFRIFIFGESAAEGDPRPQFGAGRYLEVLLRERFPASQFEVVNTAVTAINSHVILPIAQECSRDEGDVWIIYMGNNEMIGPFGAATAFGRRAPPLRIVRLGLAFQRMRIGQLLIGLLRKLTGSSGTPSSWLGMEMFLQNRIPPDDQRKEIVYGNFRRNLEEILSAGVGSGTRVLLSTVAVNLKDCAPFGSVTETNLAASDRASYERYLAEGSAAVEKGAWGEAERNYRQAAQLNPRSAELQFRLGECLLGQANPTAARDHFQAALDHDTLVFRADSRINDLILSAGRQFARRGVVLCDAEAEVAKNSPMNIPGRELFYEHVHFNFDGNYRLAVTWAEQMLSMLPAAVLQGGRTTWPSQETCERALGLTDWNRISTIEEMIRRMQLPPFSEQIGNGPRLARFKAQAEEVRRRMAATPVPEATDVYLAALKRAPQDYRIHENFAEFLEVTRDLKQATAERKTVCGLIPHYYFPYYSLGTLLKEQGQLADAQDSLLQAAALNPNQGKIHLELGIVLARRSRWREAWYELERALQLSAPDPQIRLYAAEVLWKLERQAEAVENLREALRLAPNYWEAHYRLGEDLALGGRLAEAATEFQQVLRLNPNYTKAHANLALALLKLGRVDQAAEEFGETLRLDPQNSQALEFMAQYSTGHLKGP